LAIFKVDYFREYESIFETDLAHESVDPGVLFDKKNQRSKISCYCPFKQIFRVVELAPPFPSQCSAGGVVVVALFSHKPCLFYGYEAVRVRVKILHNLLRPM
jgi:hypothetical protein